QGWTMIKTLGLALLAMPLMAFGAVDYSDCARSVYSGAPGFGAPYFMKEDGSIVHNLGRGGEYVKSEDGLTETISYEMLVPASGETIKSRDVTEIIDVNSIKTVKKKMKAVITRDSDGNLVQITHDLGLTQAEIDLNNQAAKSWYEWTYSAEA